MSISVDLVVTLTEAVNLQSEALRSMVSTKGRWLAVDNESLVGSRCGLRSHNLVTNVCFWIRRQVLVDASLGPTLLRGQTQVCLVDP
ncbi:hypothetical protein N7489_009822 [Penicillium chrysogenum]|uniref:Uncharacterized protein n=1 Tax=Penicillium chrysogenum TaxID=5076 RepID=A0ABQ8WVZ7_PENCH|nr:uncharacterized protein N7489_009822 [Penicillium chrysogenum]KAJ5229114.1 hypothetical protein N7489_009822 [Penicillium chrysogenum]KAJ5258515.1 hypothetical protein N7524_010071 [Penicillium chrysogenum]KAJ5283007.1 hypothetical protein N7505_000987 [Penicillium chrysogenum]KAJ6168987.1 hypothetical protein N7497_001830 [Penicillium chrysogenum]